MTLTLKVVKGGGANITILTLIIVESASYFIPAKKLVGHGSRTVQLHNLNTSYCQLLVKFLSSDLSSFHL